LENEERQPVPRKSSVAVAFSATTSARLQPPSDLAEPEKTLFVDLVLACRADHFQPSDTPAYCRAVVLEQTAAGELAAGGFITAEGKASPWVKILQQATRSMTTLSRMLRLSPMAGPGAAIEHGIHRPVFGTEIELPRKLVFLGFGIGVLAVPCRYGVAGSGVRWCRAGAATAKLRSRPNAAPAMAADRTRLRRDVVSMCAYS
jgi:hypothetical protein